MRRLPQELPAGGVLFNGKLYRTQAQYQAARDARAARRARLLARIEAERDGLGERR
ncbi:MAG TPA: hypothetical protein VNY55_15620 [Mycobacterium sp.]|jgi:hypothetical protein|nr:hypothetical protein [Mycobacterium sp.]